MLNGREEEPSPCRIDFTDEEVTSFSGAGSVIAEKNLNATTNFLTTRVI
jgi:hypothetical protein